MRGYIGNLTVAEKDIDFVSAELRVSETIFTLKSITFVSIALLLLF